MYKVLLFFGLTLSSWSEAAPLPPSHPSFFLQEFQDTVDPSNYYVNNPNQMSIEEARRNLAASGYDLPLSVIQALDRAGLGGTVSSTSLSEISERQAPGAAAAKVKAGAAASPPVEPESKEKKEDAAMAANAASDIKPCKSKKKPVDTTPDVTDSNLKKLESSTKLSDDEVKESESVSISTDPETGGVTKITESGEIGPGKEYENWDPDKDEDVIKWREGEEEEAKMLEDIKNMAIWAENNKGPGSSAGSAGSAGRSAAEDLIKDPEKVVPELSDKPKPVVEEKPGPSKEKSAAPSAANPVALLNKQMEETSAQIDEKLVSCKNSLEKGIKSDVERLEEDFKRAESDVGTATVLHSNIVNEITKKTMEIARLNEQLGEENQRYMVNYKSAEKELGLKETTVKGAQGIEGFTRCKGGNAPTVISGGATNLGERSRIVKCNPSKDCVEKSSSNAALLQQVQVQGSEFNYFGSNDDFVSNYEAYRVFGNKKLNDFLRNKDMPVELRRDFFDLMVKTSSLFDPSEPSVPENTPKNNTVTTMRNSFLAIASEDSKQVTVQEPDSNTAFPPLDNQDASCKCPALVPGAVLDCHSLNEKASILYAGSQESLSKLRKQMEKLRFEHQEQVKSIQLGINRETENKEDAERRLVDATESLRRKKEEKGHLRNRFLNAKTAMDSQKKECKEDLHELVNVKMCALRKLR